MQLFGSIEIMFYSSKLPISSFLLGFVWFGRLCVYVCVGLSFCSLIFLFLSFSHVQQEILRKKDTKRNGPGSWLLTCPNHQRRRPPPPVSARKKKERTLIECDVPDVLCVQPNNQKTKIPSINSKFSSSSADCNKTGTVGKVSKKKKN